MPGYVNARDSLPKHAEDQTYLEPNNAGNITTLGGAFDNGLPAMSLHNNVAIGVSTFASMDAGFITVTEPYAPAFTTCGKSSSSTVKLWTCCDCGHSGMMYSSGASCPSCYHHECTHCKTYKVKTRQ